VQFHFTPTSASWLNQVEVWFSILQGQSLSGTSFTSLKQLQEHIDAYVNAYNDKAEPFVWTKKKVRQRRFKGRRITQLAGESSARRPGDPRQRKIIPVVEVDAFYASVEQKASRPAALAAGSTDRCNTFGKLLSWGLIAQGLSGSFVELPCDRAELGLAMQGQIGAAREILAQQSVGVFV